MSDVEPVPSEPEPFRQTARGLMSYPERGWRRFFFRFPLLFWRLGLRRLLARSFLVLTTKGRKTGRPRHTMLEYCILNERVYVSPGWGKRTRWFQNILADPRVTVQVAGKTFVANATRVTNAQELANLYHEIRGKSPVWKDWLASWDVRDEVGDFIAKHDRLLPLRLDPANEPGPEPLAPDLIWIWPASLAVGSIVYAAG